MLAKSLLMVSPFVAASATLAFFFTANHAQYVPSQPLPSPGFNQLITYG